MRVLNRERNGKMLIDCMVISIGITLLILGIDQLLRLKRRGKRSRQERQSLLVGLACVPAYVVMSALGLLLSIAASYLFLYLIFLYIS